MRLIDADALKKEWTIASPEPYSTDAAEVLDTIDEAPTVDAVEVVRCKDCEDYAMWSNGRAMHYCDKYCCAMNDDDFCSYGRRKDDEELMNVQNPCDVCGKNYCDECVLSKTALKSRCSNYDCFVNHEGDCMLSIFENCGAWKEN